MSEFTLDTSGRVSHSSAGLEPYCFNDLSPFVQGYVEAMLTDTPERRILTPDQFENRCWVPLGFNDLAPETLARIMADCGPDARGYCAVTSGNMQYEFTRGGGAEFWADRQAGAWAAYPPLTVYLADDGLIYLRDGGSAS